MIISVKKPIIVFAPLSGLNSFAAALYIISKTLIEQGENVILITCKQTSCLPSFKKSSISESNEHQNYFNIKTSYFIDRKSKSSRRHKDFQKYLNSGGLLTNYEIDGFKVGKVACFDSIIKQKKLEINENESEDFDILFNSIYDCITTYQLVEIVSKKHSPKAIVFYNDYAIMHAAGEAAKKFGAKKILVSHASHKNVDFRKINFFFDDTFSGYKRKRKEWHKWRKHPLSPELVEEVNSDLIFRLWCTKQRGHVYSTPIDHGQILPDNFAPKKKVIVAFTSSPDEVFAGIKLNEGLEISNNKIRFTFGTNFNDCQIFWIKNLIKFCREKDFFLIIRVHPRESLNGESTHLQLLKKEIPSDNDHVLTIWPESRVSSYYLINYADVALTAWSTIGLEFCRMGIPVLTMTEGISNFVNDSFHIFEEDPKKYFSILEKLIMEKPSLENLKFAFRNWYLFALGHAVDISDLVFTSGYSGIPDYKTPKHSSLIKNIVNNKSDILEYNYKNISSNSDKVCIDNETEALKVSIYNLIKNFCLGYNNNEYSSVDILYLESENELSKIGKNIIGIYGHYLYFSSNGSLEKKYSKWASRLCTLLDQT